MFALVTALRGTVCKTVGYAFGGSNPPPATTCENGPLAGNSRLCGPCPRCPAVCHLVALWTGWLRGPRTHGRTASDVLCTKAFRYGTRPGHAAGSTGCVTSAVPEEQPGVPQIAGSGATASNGYAHGPAHSGLGVEAIGSVHGLADARTFGLMMRANWPDVRLSVPVPDQGMDWLVRFPAGRTLDVAGALSVQAHHRGGRRRAALRRHAGP